MLRLLERLSPVSADTFLLFLFFAFLALIAGPVGVLLYLRHQRKSRRKLVDTPRRIPLAGEEVVETPCEHARSGSRARQTADGQFVSICKKCGIPMKRNGPGDWVAAD